MAYEIDLVDLAPSYCGRSEWANGGHRPLYSNEFIGAAEHHR